MIRVKRIYDPPSKDDGLRILVDRLWPRGISKKKAQLDTWMKEIAPSDTLRKRFHHDPARWPEFKKAYFTELRTHEDLVTELKALIKKKPVTLLYGAKDTQHNQAVALKDYLESY